jgi:hypothetical protein
MVVHLLIKPSTGRQPSFVVPSHDAPREADREAAPSGHPPVWRLHCRLTSPPASSHAHRVAPPAAPARRGTPSRAIRAPRSCRWGWPHRAPSVGARRDRLPAHPSNGCHHPRCRSETNFRGRLYLSPRQCYPPGAPQAVDVHGEGGFLRRQPLGCARDRRTSEVRFISTLGAPADAQIGSMV